MNVLPCVRVCVHVVTAYFPLVLVVSVAEDEGRKEWGNMTDIREGSLERPDPQVYLCRVHEYPTDPAKSICWNKKETPVTFDLISLHILVIKELSNTCCLLSTIKIGLLSQLWPLAHLYEASLSETFTDCVLNFPRCWLFSWMDILLWVAACEHGCCFGVHFYSGSVSEIDEVMDCS